MDRKRSSRLSIRLHRFELEVDCFRLSTVSKLSTFLFFLFFFVIKRGMEGIERCLENFPSDRPPRYSPPVRILYLKNPPSVVIVAVPSFGKLIQSPLPGLQNFQSMSVKEQKPRRSGGRAGSFFQPLNFTFCLVIFFIFLIALCIFFE